MEKYWRVEAERDLSQGLPAGEGWFLDREEAEALARKKGFQVVVEYRRVADDEWIRRPYPIR